MSIFYTNKGNNIIDGNSVNSQKSTWKTLSSKKNVSKEKKLEKIYYYLSQPVSFRRIELLHEIHRTIFRKKNDYMSRKSEYLYIP